MRRGSAVERNKKKYFLQEGEVLQQLVHEGGVGEDTHRKGPRRRPTERPTKMNEVPNEILRSLEISAMMVLETPSVPSVSP